MPNRLIIGFILCLSSPLSPGQPPRMIVWNVGQGLFVTWSTPSSCLHFDMGGEFMDQQQIFGECARKNNQVVYSHWDWDHINLTRRFRFLIGQLCILKSPRGEPSEYKKKFLNSIPVCSSEDLLPAREIEFSPRSKRSNSRSRVFLHREILIPGDSEQAQEKIWALRLPRDPQVRVLILGHHGSKTSTSEFLLSKLSNLRLAVASSRKKRYGHPHSSVSKRLRRRGISVLGTEDWGHLIFGP